MPVALNFEDRRDMDPYATGLDGTSEFTPSAQTPYLSALLARRGGRNNLEEDVVDAKTRDETTLLESMHTDESDGDQDNEEATPSHSTRGIMQSSFRPVNSQAHRSGVQELDPTPKRGEGTQATSLVLNPAYQSFNPDPGTLGRNDLAESTTDVATPLNLSPGATDPNPAPSLVSDDGEFDNVQSDSESDSYTHMDLDEQDAPFLHPRLIGHDDMDIDEHTEYSFADHGKVHGPRTGRRTNPSKPHLEHHSKQRHVKFASPIRNSG